jgi:hypothetical protein
MWDTEPAEYCDTCGKSCSVLHLYVDKVHAELFGDFLVVKAHLVANAAVFRRELDNCPVHG